MAQKPLTEEQKLLIVSRREGKAIINSKQEELRKAFWNAVKSPLGLHYKF